MKKLLVKSLLYFILILLALEGLVRIFHLYTEDPPRFIDGQGVEKRIPGHTGYAVTGNRNQNFSEFRINEAGFNSFREFQPTEEGYEVALIGDSFVEGFHQDFDKSTGKRIENRLENIQVYEYGYAGYDLANQMHLVQAYADQFALIDKVIQYLDYETDLDRGTYEPNYGRIKMLSSTVFKLRDNIKLLAYGSKIGILEPFKRLVQGDAASEAHPTKEKNNPSNGENGHPTKETVETKGFPERVTIESEEFSQKKALDERRIANFKSLMSEYGFDKKKTALLLDSRKTSQVFLDFLRENNIRFIDYSESFENSKEPVTLIYDQHWNAHGRELIAEEIANYLKQWK